MKTVLVFTKKRYIKESGHAAYRRNKTRVDHLNGMTIDNAKKQGFAIYKEWCKTIKTGGNK